jgi:hypothetical protein
MITKGIGKRKKKKNRTEKKNPAPIIQKCRGFIT